MRIWLIQTGEELPIDAGPPRLARTCLVARELANRGHELIYWNASFSHQKKFQRVTENQLIDGPGYKIQLLYGREYTGHLSLSRIISQYENAVSFRAAAAKALRPDVILCGFPLIELAESVAEYAGRHGVPLAIDCRDMWPDIFSERIPVIARPFAEPALAWWRRQRRRAFSQANAITGISDAFVDWGVQIAKRPRTEHDRAFHLAVSGEEVPATALAEAEVGWRHLLGDRSENSPIVGCFAGTMSVRLDLATIARAVMSLPPHLSSKFQLVLCGDGDVRSELIELTKGHPNIFIPGWQTAAQLKALMARSDFGLLPYPSTDDFKASYPNKVGEYLGAGLPIFTGLAGVTQTLLEKYGVMASYRFGDSDSARAAIEKIIDKPETVRSKSAAARQAFVDHFDPKAIYPAFADWIVECGQHRGHGA